MFVCTCVYVCVYACVCVYVCVCVCDKHVMILRLVFRPVLYVRVGQCMSKRDGERVCLVGRGRECVYVCLCVCAYAREKACV